MDIGIISIVMSSTVAGVIISSLFSLIQNQKNSNLQYITLERKEWRNEIRKISEEISSADCNNINKVLDKLKVRINAYGNYYKGSYYQDAHIWRGIETTKAAAITSVDVLEKCRVLLIDSISLLLKQDWDRAKWEIRGNVYILLEKISLLVFAIIYEGMVIYNFRFISYYTVAFSLIIIVPFIVLTNKYSEFKEKIDIENSKDIHSAMKYVVTSLAFCGIYMYIYDKQLEVNLQNILFTLSAISCNFMIIGVPFFTWYTIYRQNVYEEKNSKEQYYLIANIISDRLIEIQEELKQCSVK